MATAACLENGSGLITEGAGSSRSTRHAPPASIFIGVPTYNGWVRAESVVGLHLATENHRWHFSHKFSSLLALCFNSLWCDALNTRDEQKWTHFAMHHADIEAAVGWVDTLIDEMDRVGADLMSVVVPIKDHRGLSSTAVEYPDHLIRRLTMKEIYQLPETFSSEDLPDDRRGLPLLVNTGLFICRFTEEWIEKVRFSVSDGIFKGDDGKWVAKALSEDWDFSLKLRELGLKVFATRKVRVVHHGSAFYTNDVPWGDWDTDRGDY